METTNIIIDGTSCEGCKKHIEKHVGAVEGVSKVEVDFQTGKTSIEHAEGLDKQGIATLIESIGKYKVRTE